MQQTVHQRKPDAATPKPAEQVVQRSAKKELAGQDFAAQEAALAPPVQMRASREGAAGGTSVQAAAAEGVRGGGQAMPHLDAIQKSFGGHDVKGVKAHVGGEAKQASETIGAEAYATGNNVAFRQQPDLFTAAHEAAHVVQQQAGVHLSGGVGQEGDTYERHADAVATQVVQGKSAESLLGKPAGGAQATGAPVQQRAAVQREEAAVTLAPAKITAAISFNQRKGLPPKAWEQVAAVVGSSSKVVDATLVKAIAAWQAKQGLAADGMCGDITFGWLAQEPGGKGLENYVKSDNILYVGLNPASKDLEHRKLVGQGANVTAIKGEREQGTAKVGGRKVNLGTDDGVKTFVDSLEGGLDNNRRDLLTSFLKNADFAAKDELAQLATALHKAETGKAIFTRAVLSGHSGGWSFWGDDNGYIPFDDLATIRAIFPKATGCVQDLMMSACNTGQGQKLDQYRAIFPNVKSIWAYVGYSPSAATGALTHMGSWDLATRGPLNEGKIDAARDRMATHGGGKGKNVATEVKKDDGTKSYKTHSPEALQSYETLKALVDSGMGHYDKAFNQGLIDKQALSVFYTNLQNLLGNWSHRLPDAAKYDGIMKRTLFLRYWENVTKKFTEQFGSQVKAGYQAAGGTMPTYLNASRDKVLGYVAAYPKPGDAAHKLLQQYLIDLDPTVLPPTWA